MQNCPFCSSEMVYPLLNTWRCKRCKNIWKGGDVLDLTAATVSPLPDRSPATRNRTEPLEKRLKKRLDEILTRSGGKFCIATMTWQAGDISLELFRRYLERCRKDRTLEETKDRYGRVWYNRRNTKN